MKMNVISYKQYGGPEVLVSAEMAIPQPKSNEALIRVHASTVTIADCMMRRGGLMARLILGIFGPRKKFQIPGIEFAGVVEKTGRDFNRFKPGDRIAGFRGFGTGCYAEYKCISSKDSAVKIPPYIGFEEAVTLVDGATTAYYFLQKAHICPGDRILVIGASGSVGSFALQLATIMGAEADGVCSQVNHSLIQSLGAKHCFDYRTDSLKAEAYDFIFDAAGKSTFWKCRPSLKRKGLYMTTRINWRTLIQHLLFGRGSGKRSRIALSIKKDYELKMVLALLDSGQLTTHIDRVFPLSQAAQAHAFVEKGKKRGNVVIQIRYNNYSAKIESRVL